MIGVHSMHLKWLRNPSGECMLKYITIGNYKGRFTDVEDIVVRLECDRQVGPNENIINYYTLCAT